jgi:nucleoside-diphosphate-sugar epimerase
MKVCVVGGAGFIGHHIVKKFLSLGHQVLVIDDLSTGKLENIPNNCEFIKSDVSEIDMETLVNYLEGVDLVYHTAAKARVQPSIVDPISFNRANVDSTLRILVASHRSKVKRVIYSASSSVYGDTNIFPTPETANPNPMSPYGLQKFIGEQYCKLFSEVYNLDTVSLRYFNVYVGDVVEANYLAGVYEESFNGDVFNVGNGDNYSINEIADLFESEKVYNEQRLEPYITLADNSKIKNKLGWITKGNVISWVKKYKKTL